MSSDLHYLVDPEGFEPLTSALRTQRSPERDITHPLSIWKGMEFKTGTGCVLFDIFHRTARTSAPILNKQELSMMLL